MNDVTSVSNYPADSLHSSQGHLHSLRLS